MTSFSFFAAEYEICRTELLKFRNANRDTKRDIEYFDWRYLGRPSSRKPVIVWAYDALADKKVGAISLIPHDYLIDNKLCSVGILGDISVLKEARGKALSQRMLAYMADLKEVKGLKGCVVLPNEQATGPLERAGWHKMIKLERYKKILNVEEALVKRFKKKALMKVLSKPINFLLKIFSCEYLIRVTSSSYGELCVCFDDRFDDLWNALDKKDRVLGLRNRCYLSWRYSKHPTVKYLTYTLVSDRRLLGYIIFHQNKKICVIDDLLCLNPLKNAPTLLFLFIRYVRNILRASEIVVSASKSALEKIPLRRFGFMKRPDYRNFMVAPLTNPGRSGIFEDGNKWTVTTGDKDV